MKHWPAISMTAGVLALAAVALAYCRPKPTPIPPREQKTLDSLNATNPDYIAKRDTLVRVEKVYVAKSAQDRVGARQSSHAADSLRQVAIAAQRQAEAARDSVSALRQWREAALAYHAEADSLRASNRGLEAALESQLAARTAADARADDAERRRQASEDLNARLATDLRRSDPPCRVAWVFTCPSRKVAYTVGVVTPIVVKVVRNVAKHDSPLAGLRP